MRKLARFAVYVAIVFGIVVGVLRATVVRPWTVPADPMLAASLEPTLSAGDTVLLLTKRTPKFGDLMRCADPNDATRFVAGRIVGVEGDVVETAGARLEVNGRRYDAEVACTDGTFTVAHPTTGAPIPMMCDVVNLGDGWHYRGLLRTPVFTSAPSRTTVARGTVYLMSDNRHLHHDSRDFGLLPAESCTERVVVRVTSKLGWSDARSRMSFIR